MKFILLILLAMACSHYEKKQRIISSADSEKVSQTEDDDSYIFKVEKMTAYKSFNIPLVKLETMDYYPLEYELNILSENLNCRTTGRVKELKANKSYKVGELTPRESVLCENKLSDKFAIGFEYKIPKLKNFDLGEAHWKQNHIKKQFKDIDIQLSRINKKFADRKPLLLTEKELLIKEFGQEKSLFMSSSKKGAQLVLELDEGDYFYVENFSGATVHEEWGVIDYMGKDFAEKGFTSKSLPKFAFFCKSGEKVFLPSYGTLLVSQKGKLKCYLNTRNKRIFERKKFWGEVKIIYRVLKITNAVNQIFRRLQKANKRIEDIVLQYNKKNLDRFNSYFEKLAAREDFLPYSGNEKFRKVNVYSAVDKRHITLEPYEYLNEEEKKSVLHFHIYKQREFEAYSGKLFKESKIFLGQIKTNKEFSKNAKKIQLVALNEKVERELFMILQSYIDSDYLFSELEHDELKDIEKRTYNKAETVVPYHYLLMQPVRISECKTQESKALYLIKYDISNNRKEYNREENLDYLYKGVYDTSTGKIKAYKEDEHKELSCSAFQSL